ncbi:MAG TPA: phage tail sheath C-terminal domain-containing protein [Thermoanaerobaculia bacterium]
MPVQVSYPGVYVQEIPTSNPTVIGVTTSSTAFVDFFPSGPVGTAVQVNSWNDFQRIFGGLDARSESSYAIMQYFLNGGQVAWVIRVVDPTSATASPPGVLAVDLATGTPATSLADNATVLGGSTAQASWSIAPSGAINPASYTVYLSTDGGISFNPVQSNATSPYTVTLPSVTQASQGVVQVVASDASGNVLASATSPPFTIVPGQVVLASPPTSPQAGGASVALSWSWAGSGVQPSFYSVLMSQDGGRTFQPVPSGMALPSKTNSLSVTLPTPSSAPLQVVLQVLATDVNGNPIAIAEAPVQVEQTTVEVASGATSPETAGTASVSWTTAGATASAFNVFLSTDGGKTFPSTPANGGTPATSPYSLTLPTVDAPQQAAVQVVALDANNNQIGSGVSTPFTIAPAGTATIAISAPTAGASETAGTPFAVSWPPPTVTGTVASYSVLLSTDGGATFQSVQTAAPTGTTTLTTNVTAPAPASQAVVQVEALDDSGKLLALGESGIFTIAAAAATPPANPPQFVIRAISPGAWGNTLQVSLTPNPDGSFNLSVQQVVSGTTVASETYKGLTYGNPNDPHYAPSILAASSLIQLAPYPATFPGLALSVPDGAYSTLLSGGTDGAVVDLDSAANALGNAFGVSNPLGPLDNIAPSVFNLLCLPWLANLSGGAELSIATQAMAFCGPRQAFYIMDIPESVSTPGLMQTWANDYISASNYYAAAYFPRLVIADPLNNYRPRNSPASGTLAGVYALNDTNAGVWVAPAGVNAVLQGIMGLAYNLTDSENGQLNPLGINCLRTFPVYNNIVWGARTLAGADQIESEWKYIPVRRLIDYIEQSLVQSLKWAVFQPNGPQLWTQISVEVGTFLSGLYSQGALYGATPSQAYFVNCDSTTTTPTDMAQGIVNIVVGVAPVDPAEFVILTIQQIVGQTQAS